MKLLSKKILFAILFLMAGPVFATAYPLPNDQQSLIGRIQYYSIGSNDTVTSIAKKYDVGFNAIEGANPQLDLKKKLYSYGNTVLTVPTQHLLPNLAREGIVVNLPEMRLYYYEKGTNQIITYPIGIGKIGKTIPIQRAIITRKATNPTWVPTEDIRQFNLTQGVVVPQVVPPGPDNPLGPFAIYTSIPTYLFHSTIFPESVGKRASFGCIRMYESDVKELFPSMVKGIPFVIINSPIKLGWEQNKLFMEAHPSLEEHQKNFDATLPGTVAQINDLVKDQKVLVDWQAVAFINKERDGLPHEIGMRY